MEVEFLILADAVDQVGGKLYMLGGGWTQWRSSSYPAQVRVGFAISLRIDWEETNVRHPVILEILDADGIAVVPAITAQVEAGRPTGIVAGTPQRAILALNANFPLPRPGRYEVRAKAGTALPRVVIFDAVLTGGALIQPG